MPWLTPQTVSWLAKPWRVDRHHHLTSSHKTQREEPGGEQRREGRLQTHNSRPKHSPSALLVCDTLPGKRRVCSLHWLDVDVGSLIHFSHGRLLLQTLAPVPVSFYPPLRPWSRFSTEGFFFPLRQDVARDWFSSASDAFMGCRIKNTHGWNRVNWLSA